MPTTKKTATKPATKGQHVGYIRVSTLDQNTARQLDGVDLDRAFTDKASGKDRQRPQLEACIAHLRDGDHLHIHSMDRLARNIVDLIAMVDSLNAKGVTVQFHKEMLTFEPIRSGMDAHRASMARLMLSIMGSIAEFERSLILERQREGIAVAKAEGKYKGSKKKLSEAQEKELKERVEGGESKASIARSLGISRETLYTYLAAKDSA